jgi:hypothetical protein
MHFYLRRIRHDLMGFQVEILGTPRIGFVWGRDTTSSWYE